MKIAYFDTIAGISGDMTLGAFVSAGLPFKHLRSELQKLGLTGFELQASHVGRSGIIATKIDVVVSDPQSSHRHLRDIKDIIDKSGLTPAVKDRADKIFHEVAVAEARVHHSTPEKIHFHEVGAVDSIVDIVGASLCIDYFGIERIYSSPVKLGSGGFVNTQHGKMPIPTPATIEILKEYPTLLTEFPYELTTPTGAAIIKALSAGILAEERISIQAIGYGAGTREMPEVPNLLRVLIGDLDPLHENDEIVSIETNIDDMNPEIYPYVIEQLLARGAHDAFLIPLIMKKGRPGMMVSILVERSKVEMVLAVLFRETTTLGVRIQPVERKKLPRSEKIIQTSFGGVRCKSVLSEGRERLIPEFEECKRIAKERDLPLKDVYTAIEHEIRSGL